MICLETIEQFHINEPTALTIGKFDGLHRGHEELLSHQQEKQDNGLKSVVFTFDIPPKKLTEGERLQLLSTNGEKQAIFAVF